MYPHKIFLGLTLYDILICVGIILCFFVFGFLSDKRKMKVKHQKFSLVCGCFAIAAGLFSASLFQAIYNIPSRGGFEFLFKITEDGKIELVNTGITFYGGLVGGVAVFLLIYFIFGRLFYKKTDTPSYHNENFFSMASSAVASITIAHSIGRLGCLTAGCCHGAVTDAWYGIMMHGGEGYAKYVPAQLFEAIFLLLLFAFLFVNAYRGGRYNLPIYMSAYGVWRFIIEFVRDDYRGSVGIENITPSQLIAILMILGSVGVFFLEKVYTDKVEARYAELSRVNADIGEPCEEKESDSEENN